MTPLKYQQTLELLHAIEVQLQQLDLWSAQPPTVEALASQAPFCCDTMPFSAWLQFVLLPRMQVLVAGRLALPAQISICPIAEEAFRSYGSAALPLINRIADLDELLSGKREQTVERR